MASALVCLALINGCVLAAAVQDSPPCDVVGTCSEVPSMSLLQSNFELVKALPGHGDTDPFQSAKYRQPHSRAIGSPIDFSPSHKDMPEHSGAALSMDKGLDGTLRRWQENERILPAALESRSRVVRLDIHSSAGPVTNRTYRETALRDVVEFLTDANVSFVVVGGASLGIIRNGTLEEEDDDIDIQVADDAWDMLISSGASSLEKLVREKRRLGYEDSNEEEFWWSWWFDKYEDWWFLKLEGDEWGPLTLHLLRDVDPALVQEHQVAGDLLCSDEGLIPRSDLFPARLVNPSGIPGLTLPVPNHAEKRFEARYGTDWRTPKAHFKAEDRGGWTLRDLSHEQSVDLFRLLCPDWVCCSAWDNSTQKVETCG